MEQPQLNQLFQQAQQQLPEASFSETKTAFLNSFAAPQTGHNGNGIANLLTLKTGIIMSTIISIVIGAVLYLTPAEPAVNSSPTPLETPSHITIPTDTSETNEPRETTSVETSPEVVELQLELDVDPTELVASQEHHAQGVLYQSTPVGTAVRAAEPLSQLTDPYRFPTLTPEQIEANDKQKKLMLKQRHKLHKSAYAQLPSGTFDVDDEKVSVQGFYMQTTEVSVLEYRTFLFDLLIQNRQDDFLIAKPDQSKWAQHKGNQYPSMQPMEESYFSESAYNEHPINNISRAGAQMYCNWLSNEYYKSGKKGENVNDVRLPSHYEWVYAASASGAQTPYPWGGPKATNEYKCFLANFRIKGFDWKLDAGSGCPNGAYADAFTSGGYMLGKGTCTVKVVTYNPNVYGLYNMSGNVAEMVTHTEQNNAPAANGGGWLSNVDEIKIDNTERYEGVEDANLNIGFRVVISGGQ
jgi:formylglycine-generating enzyme required for sulfatase activity